MRMNITQKEIDLIKKCWSTSSIILKKLLKGNLWSRFRSLTNTRHAYYTKTGFFEHGRFYHLRLCQIQALYKGTSNSRRKELLSWVFFFLDTEKLPSEVNQSNGHFAKKIRRKEVFFLCFRPTRYSGREAIIPEVGVVPVFCTGHMGVLDEGMVSIMKDVFVNRLDLTARSNYVISQPG